MIHRTMMMILTTMMLIIGGVDGVGQDTWVKTFGGTSDDKGYSITTIDDNILITGKVGSKDGDFKGMIYRDYGDIFVIKLDKDGQILWKRLYGGKNTDEGLSITATNDGGLVLTGWTESEDGDFKGMEKGWGDIFVIKLNTMGDVVWKKTFGGSSNRDKGYSVTSTLDGGIVLTGQTDSDDGDFTRMHGSVFVMKLDKDGEIQWKKTFGGDGIDEGNSITATSDGCILITGRTFSTSIVTRRHLWDDTSDIEKGNGDIFVIKLDKDGQTLWKRLFGGNKTDDGLSRDNSDEGLSIKATNDDGVVLTGWTNSSNGDFEGLSKGKSWVWDHSTRQRARQTSDNSEDVFVIKLDRDGETVWKKTLGGTGDERGYSITTTSDGGMVLTGNTSSNDGDFKGMDKGNDDIFVIKLNSTGEVEWKRTFGGRYNEKGMSITATKDDGIFLTGYTSSNDGDFKGMDKGSENIFVIKLNSNGNLKPSGNKKSKKK